MLCLMQFPALSDAASLTGDSRTYIQSRQTVDNQSTMPFYEYLNLSVQDAGSEAVSIHFGGWLGMQTDLTESNDNTDLDLQYGYVRYGAKEHNASVSLGRVMVFEGIAAERVDGIYARTDIKGGFGISAFGGSAAETGIDAPGNNTIIGGRISHQMASLYAIGASFVKQEKNSLNYRNEQGIDLWVRPIKKAELMGRSSFNAETKGWMEHAYFLALGPFDALRFNTEVSRISYEDYFASTTTNVFKMAAGGVLDPRENVMVLGEEVVYAINKNWTASVDYKDYGYTLLGNAGYYGGKVTYALPKAYHAGFSLHKMDGDTKKLQYDEYRIYASKKMSKTDVAIDILEVKYKEPINHVSNAFSATIAAGYELLHNMKVGLDVEYAKNPDFDKDVRVFAKLVWSFDAGSGSAAPAAQKTAPAAEVQPATPSAPATGSDQPAAQAVTEQGKPKEGI